MSPGIAAVRERRARGFLKDFHDANQGARPCGLTVKGGVPAELVACRGVPIVSGRAKTLGELPPVSEIPARMAGAGDMTLDHPDSARFARWHMPEADVVELSIVRNKGVTRVTLPAMNAWTCGSLSFGL